MAVVETLTAATFTRDARRRMVSEGVAMSDGTFPIRNRSDLRDAIRLVGRARNPEAARVHIEHRARVLGLTGMLPGGRQAVTASADWESVPTTSSNVEATWSLSASVGIAPLAPPAEWFENPRLDGPTPLTVTADGRVFGHLAEHGKCHRGISGRCVFVPRSKNDYRSFYAGGQIMLDNGEQVPVGRLTVNAHHASLSASPTATAAHYDHSGTVAAFVRAGEDRHGVWLAGATRSDATPEQIRDLRANPPSGDWRNTEGRGLELVAALAVPVPGFPVMAVAASAHEGGPEQVTALILGYSTDEPLAVVAGAVDVPLVDAAGARIRTRVLAARIRGGVSGLAELFQ